MKHECDPVEDTVGERGDTMASFRQMKWIVIINWKLESWW
jgi:hypothetical protein